MNRKAQEEMVGFGIIIVIVMIILMVFIGISVKSNNSSQIQSYEVNSFIQSFLQYSSSCKDYFGELNVQDLIYLCNLNKECLDETNSCEILNSTLKEINSASWKVSNESIYKGYNLRISSGDKIIFQTSDGQITNNYRSGIQKLPPKHGEMIDVLFNVYS